MDEQKRDDEAGRLVAADETEAISFKDKASDDELSDEEISDVSGGRGPQTLPMPRDEI